MIQREQVAGGALVYQGFTLPEQLGVCVLESFTGAIAATVQVNSFLEVVAPGGLLVLRWTMGYASAPPQNVGFCVGAQVGAQGTAQDLATANDMLQCWPLYGQLLRGGDVVRIWANTAGGTPVQFADAIAQYSTVETGAAVKKPPAPRTPSADLPYGCKLYKR